MFVRANALESFQHFIPFNGDSVFIGKHVRQDRIPNRMSVQHRTRLSLLHYLEMEKCFVRRLTATIDNASTLVNQENLFSSEFTFVYSTRTHSEQQGFCLYDSTQVSAGARQPSACVQRLCSRGKLCRDFTECRACSVGRSLHHRSSKRFIGPRFILSLQPYYNSQPAEQAIA